MCDAWTHTHTITRGNLRHDVVVLLVGERDGGAPPGGAGARGACPGRVGARGTRAGGHGARRAPSAGAPHHAVTVCCHHVASADYLRDVINIQRVRGQ